MADPLIDANWARFYNFPALFTLQRNENSRQSQLRTWSRLIQRYCQYHKIWRLNVTDALETPIFHNSALKKGLNHKEATQVIEYMCSESGDHRAEWVSATEKVSAWIYWRTPDDWAEFVAAWVDGTGQKGVILTLYELTEGEGTTQQEFYGMPSELLKKVLGSLVKKGKAQVFGTEGEQGVKFF